MRVIFSHGKESGPWGSKISAMASLSADLGFNVESIDYRDLTDDAEKRVERLLSKISGCSSNTLLVGSSMGGYVSTVASCKQRCAGLFLLAPALYMEGYDVQSYNPNAASIEVVHGWSDDIVLPETSIRFAKESNCTLHLIPGDHRLNSSLPEVLLLFSSFLQHAQPLDI